MHLHPNCTTTLLVLMRSCLTAASLHDMGPSLTVACLTCPVLQLQAQMMPSLLPEYNCRTSTQRTCNGRCQDMLRSVSWCCLLGCTCACLCCLCLQQGNPCSLYESPGNCSIQASVQTLLEEVLVAGQKLQPRSLAALPCSPAASVGHSRGTSLAATTNSSHHQSCQEVAGTCRRRIHPCVVDQPMTKR
jgi:hypothetical protein